MRLPSMLVFLVLLTAGCRGGTGGDDEVIDAAPLADADPSCQSLDSLGGFSDCSVCDELGSGCDTIDNNGQTSRVCDCSAPCPCGLRCGDIELAPGVVVGNVCIR